jgi:hypothetical protein
MVSPGLPEGPLRSALGLWRGLVRWDSGRASMERDTVRKLMSRLKNKIIALQPRGKVSTNAGFDQRGCCNAHGDRMDAWVVALIGFVAGFLACAFCGWTDGS